MSCPVDSCVITNDKNYLDSVFKYDAVVFHTAEMWNLLTPTPSKRSVHQKYVLANMESPAHSKHDLSNKNDFFNWTMTYR